MEFGLTELLVTECLRLPHPRQTFLEVGVDHRNPLPGPVVDFRRTAPKDGGRDPQGNDHHEAGRRQPPVEEEERHPDPHEGADAHHRGDQTALQQRLEGVHVGRHAGHDATGHLALVVVEGQSLQLCPDPDSQRHHDPLGGPARDERLADLVDEVGERDDEIDRRGGEEDRFGADRDAIVDAGLDEDRPGQRRERIHDDEHEPDEEWLAELP